MMANYYLAMACTEWAKLSSSLGGLSSTHNAVITSKWPTRDSFRPSSLPRNEFTDLLLTNTPHSERLNCIVYEISRMEINMPVLIGLIIEKSVA